MTFHRLLLSALAATWPVAAGGTSAAQPEEAIKALREKVFQSDRVRIEKNDWETTPGDVKAKAYKALFLKAGRAGLHDLITDEDTGIALQAAWETRKKITQERVYIGHYGSRMYDRGVLGGFLEFLKVRTGATPPGWWADSIVTVDVDPGVTCTFPLLEENRVGAGPRLREAEAGGRILVPQGADLKATGDDLVYSAVGRTVRFPTKTFLPWWSYAGLLGNKWSVISGYGLDGGTPFKLAGFTGEGGMPAWMSPVWCGMRPRVLGNPGRKFVELTGVKDAVFVWVGGNGGMEVEAFDLATGRCQFRFSATYWRNPSEAWGLK
jgi:hypothetical protein